MPQLIVAAIWFVITAVELYPIVGTIALALLQVGLAIGVSAIEKSLAPKPGLRGSSTQVSLSANDPRRVSIGRTATAGALVTFQTWGSNNANIVLIFRVADHKCTALNRVFWGGKQVTLGGGGAVSQFNTDGADHCWITFMDGSWGQAADADLIANSGGRWTSNDRGRGVAYVKVKALANNKAFPGGINDLFQFLFEIDGAALYDRRLDTSAGGSGSQRWNDQSTWTLNANAAVVTENFLRGFRAEDTTVAVGSRTVDYFMGLQLPDNVLPFAENVAAMNHCDESVSLKAGGSELRYKMGGVATADQTGDTILSDFLATMAGKLLTGPGRFVILPGVTQTSVRTFVDGDLRLDGPFNYSQDVGLDTVANAVVGQFLDPAGLYTAQPLPPRTSSADATEDGGVKTDTLDLSYVTSQTQGQRVQEIHRRRARRQRTMTQTLGPENMDLEGGDWITNNFARFNTAWGGTLTFEILQTQPIGTDREDELLQFVVSLQEVDSGIFAWTAASDELSRQAPVNISSADPTSVNVTGLTATAISISGAGGQVTPALQVTRNAVTDSIVNAITYTYWPHGSPSSAKSVTYPVTPALESGTQSAIIDPVVGGVQYDVEAAFITAPATVQAMSSVVTTSGSTPAAVAGSTTGAIGGANRVPYSLFEAGADEGWRIGYNPHSLTITSTLQFVGGLVFLEAAATSGGAGWDYSIYGSIGQFPVTAGERISFSALLTSSNAVVITAVFFRDASGNGIGSPTGSANQTAINQSTPLLVGGFATAPAGAVTGELIMYAVANASGAMYEAFAQPMVASASASQAVLPYFTPGPNAQAGSTSNQIFVQATDPALTQLVLDGAFWDDTANGVGYKRINGSWIANAGTGVGPGTSYLITALGSGTFSFLAGSYTHADVFLVGQSGHGNVVSAGKGATYYGGGGGEERESTGLSVVPGTTTLGYNLSAAGASTTSGLVSLSANKGGDAGGSAGVGASGGSGGTSHHNGRNGGLTNSWDGGAAWNPQNGAYNPDNTTINTNGVQAAGVGTGAGAGPMVLIILRS